MAKEVEVKILNVNPTKLRKLLKAHNAQLKKNVFQRNSLYQNAYTKKKKIILRIREEGDNATLTVKANRRTVGKHKVTDEYETAIGNAVEVKKMLLTLGFERFGVTELKREYYLLGGCSVELVHFPGVPYYLELEGTKQQIAKAASLLGYTDVDFEPRTIFEVYSLHLGNFTFKK